ncbi:hypothetical protein CYMTET_24284 [Cymbomonas tetramitiformis]|uniref:Uncharacterized protein n=1 Tax=Cymbomonas tetramitiformis TaxID=36881 RepID=A0AAE0FXI9_9CHLO|nr:hypothetical protein CYMTET_24284 [Cymbomonas tetramitiformis]|eukprot:gene18965-22666_t
MCVQGFPYADPPAVFLHDVETTWLDEHHVLTLAQPVESEMSEEQMHVASAMLFLRTAAVVLTLESIIDEHLRLHQRYYTIVAKCVTWWKAKSQGKKVDQSYAAVVREWTPFLPKPDSPMPDPETIWAIAQKGMEMSKVHVDEAIAEKELVLAYVPTEGELDDFIKAVKKTKVMHAAHLFSTEPTAVPKAGSVILPSYGQRYTVYIEWEDSKKMLSVVKVGERSVDMKEKFDLVKGHYDVTMQDLVRAHHGNMTLPAEPYLAPAMLLRDLESWTQFLHNDLSADASRLPRPEPDHPESLTWSAGLVFDEQYYTELLPESEQSMFWRRHYDDEREQHFWGFQLPDARHGYPTSTPFKSVLVGGPTGSINMWPADRTAHRGISPQVCIPGGQPSLVRPKQMSVVMYSAIDHCTT